MANPMDMVIGAEEAQRDSKTSGKHLDAARAASRAGDFHLEVAELRRAVNADPLSTHALFELAYRLDLMGEEDEALALYSKSASSSAPPRPSTP
jgi:DNA-directed RNA polymerase subunit alpha